MTTNLIWSATRRLLSLSFLAFPLVSLAGNQTTSTKRPQVVVITAMEMGDVACYLTFRNEAWEEKTALASHDICSQVTLLYQKSEITFRQATVLGDSCEGNPECTDLKKVWLVDSAKRFEETLCRDSEVLFHGCTTNKNEIIAFCTEPKSRGVLDVRPNYLVVRVGTRKGINMEVAFKAASDLNYQMLRLAGANTRQSFAWKHAAKSYLFESSYLNGQRLHGLSVYQGNKQLSFEPCFDHEPEKEVLLTPNDF